MHLHTLNLLRVYQLLTSYAPLLPLPAKIFVFPPQIGAWYQQVLSYDALGPPALISFFPPHISAWSQQLPTFGAFYIAPRSPVCYYFVAPNSSTFGDVVAPRSPHVYALFFRSICPFSSISQPLCEPSLL